MKIFVRVLITLGLLLLMAAIFGIYYVQRSAPQTDGSVELPAMASGSEVYFDNFGIPHIYAETAEDAYRSLGYVHAQDRLFQMELVRRVGRGTLSEVLGPDMVQTDAFFRTLGTHRQAAQDAARFERLPDSLRSKVTAYLDGVNAFAEKGPLPIEFTLTQIDPKPFTVEDVYATAAYMAYSFAYALRTDPIVEHITGQLDSAYLAGLDLAFAEKDTTRTAVFAQSSAAPQRPGLKFLEHLPVPMLQGSNAWAVAPSRSASGKALLANDTHIKYGSPSVWYEAHINYPGTELYGNFMAGIPFPLIGHTRRHAWGVTMFEDDDSDFFIQEWAADDSSETRFGEGQSRPVTKHREVVKVKGQADRVFTVYETEDGPIINDFLPAEYPAPVAMYWNYTCIDNELFEAFSGMADAADMAEFRKAASKVGSPGLNLTYADAEGNIASWSCSKLLRRPDHLNGKVFARGYAPEDAYLGFHDFDDNPSVVNPESGFIAVANQFHRGEDGIDYSGYYAPNHRYERITEMISGSGPVDVDVMKTWGLDVTSKAQATAGRAMCEAIGDSLESLNAWEKALVAEVRDWDGGHERDALAPVIYYKWLFHTVDKTMRDELGDDLFETLLSTHLFTRSYPKLLADAESPWWDDLHTDERETRADIVLAAFWRTAEELRRDLGPDYESWRWGDVHSIEHGHPLGEVDALRGFFNVGPFPAPGGTETVNNAGFKFNGSGAYEAHYGPAMRIHIDFADVEAAVSVLPTGNSGNVMSDHYSDQAEMYINGEFRPMLMNRKVVEKEGTRLTILP